MAEKNRSTQVVVFNLDQYDTITLELGDCMAQLHMLSTAAAHDVLEELPEHTLTRYIINLQKKFQSVIDIVHKSSKTVLKA